METELAALAASGAATLITLMVSDSWALVKTGLARAFGRTGDTERAARELEASRAALLAALSSGDDATVTKIESEWRERLLDLLRRDPALTEDLRSLPKLPPDVVRNIISGKVRAGLVIQAGRISESTFHLSSRDISDVGGEG